MENINQQIEKILENVRPSLQMDGGDVKFVSFQPDSGIVEVELQGHCANCPMSTITLKQGIEAELRKAVTQVKKVVAV
jgi:Fe-S cluster biogenesis protein NfuA